MLAFSSKLRNRYSFIKVIILGNLTNIGNNAFISTDPRTLNVHLKTPGDNAKTVKFSGLFQGPVNIKNHYRLWLVTNNKQIISSLHSIWKQIRFYITYKTYNIRFI